MAIFTTLLVLLLQASQLLPCHAQEAIVDDDDAWNSFFRDLRATPQFPYPGTLNNAEWDQYTLGFMPSLWDTKDFLSILVIKPYYVGGHAGTQPVLWENFWAFFDIFLHSVARQSNPRDLFSWTQLNINMIWATYIQMLKELYCCHQWETINGTFGFGCMNATRINDCCRKDKLLSTCTDVGQEIVKEWSSGSIQAMKFKFYYWLCVVYVERVDLEISAALELLRICPNPCRNDPCNEIPNAERDSCIQLPRPRGSYRNEFICNRCVPHNDSDTFMCECVQPYRREVNAHKLAAAFRRTAELISDPRSTDITEEVLPPDNCMAKHDACDKFSCGGADGTGRCMPSGDLLFFVCICTKNEDGYPLFEGEYCETPISQWRDWSHWGVCRPECGDSCFQARQRLCGHLDGHAYCKGADEELRACEPACRPCPNRSFAHLSGVFVKETGAPLLLAIVSLFLAQLLGMAALEWLFSPDVTRPV